MRDISALLALTFADITHPDDLAEDLGLVEQLLRGDIRSYEMEKRYLRPDGQTVQVLLSVSLLYADGEPQYFIAHILDITARRRDEEALKVAAADLAALNCELGILSTTDPLTGTSNRRHLDDVLAAACHTAQRHKDPVAVLLIDIDRWTRRYQHRLAAPSKFSKPRRRDPERPLRRTSTMPARSTQNGA